MDAKQTRQGVLLALAAYFIWGIAPAYFKFIHYVPADEILTHRVIWSFFFMIALMSVSRQWSGVKTLLKTPKKVFLLALSAVLIGGNWLLFIWAVNNHHMLEASLGYFINPLVNIVLGMIFLGERFRRMQWGGRDSGLLRRAGSALDFRLAAGYRLRPGVQLCVLRAGT
ncbi:transporter DMT superfamily protein [Enterobacter cancerogenus]|uniref:Transporter DMT superfamily protein n=1 Tax=Enterobacter cancerogenus TaxID=69218 RepID=A0A484WVT1_9ENTR|nr:transporter DMT superfamily protein [Enterobacter cancerogenus]